MTIKVKNAGRLFTERFAALYHDEPYATFVGSFTEGRLGGESPNCF